MKKRYIAIAVAGIMAATFLTACGVRQEPPSKAMNTVPVIEGVGETLQAVVGQPFNALDGVTATDEQDGDLTSSIVVTSVPSLDFTNGIATPTLPGYYELTYSVTDSGGLTMEEYGAVAVTRVVDSATELLRYDFGDGLAGDARGWTSEIFEPAAGTAQPKEGGYVFDITNSGTADYNINFHKTISANAVNYRVRFWLKSSVPTFVNIGANDLQNDGNSLGGIFNQRVGTTVDKYDLEFTVQEAGDVDIRMVLGKITADSESSPEAFTLTVDKVEFYEITGSNEETALFDEDFENNVDSVSLLTWNNSSATVSDVDGKAQMNIDAYPTDGVWNLKMYVDVSPAITFEPGKTYYCSADVTSAQNQSFEFLLASKSKDQNARAMWSQYMLAAGESNSLYVTFTTDNAGLSDYGSDVWTRGEDGSYSISDLVVCFQLGAQSAGVTSNVFTVDNVRIGEVEGDRSVEKTYDRFFLYGDENAAAATRSYPFGTYNGTDEDHDKGVGVMWIDNGDLFYRIDQGSSTDWHNKLMIGLPNNPISLPANSVFEISFTVRATRNIPCNVYFGMVGTWPPIVQQDIAITAEEKTFTLLVTEPFVVPMPCEVIFQFGSSELALGGEVTIEFTSFVITQTTNF